MNPKDAFWALISADRRRITYLMAALGVVHILQFLIAAPGTTLSPWLGAALNGLVVYWCLLPARAPGFWFRMIPYAWWISAIFDGFAIVRFFAGHNGHKTMLALSTVNVCILPFLAGPLFRFYRLTRTG